jgi:hypothetical protein
MREGVELVEREQDPPPPEGNMPPPPKRGAVEGVPGREEEVPKMVIEEAKGAEEAVNEEAKGSKEAVVKGAEEAVVEEAKAAEEAVVEEAKGANEVPPRPGEPRETKGGVETKRPQVLKRGSSARRIADMEPGEERHDKVVRMEDDGQLTNWQGKKGRGRTTSSTSSEGESSPARKRKTTEAGPPQETLREKSPFGSPPL